jgi:hypothetical protein
VYLFESERKKKKNTQKTQEKKKEKKKMFATATPVTTASSPFVAVKSFASSANRRATSSQRYAMLRFFSFFCERGLYFFLRVSLFLSFSLLWRG